MTFEQVVAESLAVLEPTVKSARKGASAAIASGKMLGDGEIKNISRKLVEAEEELACALERPTANVAR